MDENLQCGSCGAEVGEDGTTVFGFAVCGKCADVPNYPWERKVLISRHEAKLLGDEVVKLDARVSKLEDMFIGPSLAEPQVKVESKISSPKLDVEPAGQSEGDGG